MKHKYIFKAQDLNKKYAQKILDRDRMIIRVKEANKHLKEQSLNLSGISSPLTSTLGGKKISDVPDNISNGDMEAEIDDLRLQLEERDKEVKVSNAKLLIAGNIYYYSFTVHQSKSTLIFFINPFRT